MSGFIDGRNGFIDGRIYEKGFATQRLVLRTDQAATMIATVAFGHHAVFLIRVDRDVGRDVPLGQQLTEGAFAVAGVRNPATPQARYKLTRDTSDNSATAFDSRSEAWAPRGVTHPGVPTPADDDVLMRNTSVINDGLGEHEKAVFAQYLFPRPAAFPNHRPPPRSSPGPADRVDRQSGYNPGN